MARTINMRPRAYYGRCASYCKRRATLALDPMVQWFWLSGAQRFDHLAAGDTARVNRFKSKPWRFPNFKYH